MDLFLNQAELGKNNWWRYLLSLIIIIVFWMVIGSIPAGINLILETKGLEVNFIGLMVSFVFLILGLWLAIRGVHKRKFITLITTKGRVNWNRYFYGFGITMAISLVLTGIDYLWHPGSYRFVLSNWTIVQFMTMLIISLLFIPIQTAAEELLFRGYILQSIGRKLKNPYVLSIITAVIFTVPHLGNPEVTKQGFAVSFSYFIIAVLLGLVTLKSNGLELAMGIHCAINLFSAVVVNMSDSALVTRPIFLLEEWGICNLMIGQIALCVLLYLTVMRYIKKNLQKGVM